MDAVFLSELLWKPVTKDGEHLSLLELLEQDRRYPQGLSNLWLEESGKELHLEVQIINLLFDYFLYIPKFQGITKFIIRKNKEQWNPDCNLLKAKELVENSEQFGCMF